MSSTLVNNKEIHYQQYGQGDIAVILIHGFTCDSSDWRYQIEHLTPHCKMVVLDLNGHGQSSTTIEDLTLAGLADDVIALAELLGFQQAALVGHSMGCRVVMEMLSRPESQFSKGVLIDGSRSATPETLDAILAGSKQIADNNAYRGFIQHMFEEMFFDEKFKSIQDPVVQRAQAFPEDSAKQLSTSLLQWDALKLEAAAEKISVPIFIIQANGQTPEGQRKTLKKGDTTTWMQVFEQIVAPDLLDTVIIEDAGHFVMLEQPEQINKLLDQYLL